MEVECDDWLALYTQIKQERDIDDKRCRDEDSDEDLFTLPGERKKRRLTNNTNDGDECEIDLTRDQALHDAHVALSRQFCEQMLARPHTCVPHCRPEQFIYNQSGERMQHIMERLAQALVPPPSQSHKNYTHSGGPRTPDDKRAFYCKSTESEIVLQFQFSNFVTVTYLGNAATGDDLILNLCALLISLLAKGAEFRRKKFAKANVRLWGAGSMMIYGSGIIVESGCDCTELSRRMMEYMVRVLREECGYRQLYIQRRLCFNIVATGNVRVMRDGEYVSHPLCLALIKQSFPRASYKKDKFKGVIIKLVDLDQWLQTENASRMPAGSSRTGAPEYRYTTDYKDDGDDETAFIARVNRSCEYDTTGLATGRLGHGSGRQRARLEIKAESSEDADARRNATLEEFAQLAGKTESDTYLIFKDGLAVYTGGRTKRRVYEGYDKIYTLLIQCISTPENCAKVTNGCDCHTRK
jgi:TATA-box binding protein (TBP) (component of TFIID and TFIIIB)